METHISIVITAHSEGTLAHRTMKSVFRAVELAKSSGIVCEIIVVKDQPTPETTAYFNRFTTTEIKLMETNFGDPGLARNFGISHSTSKYVALLDADDLFSRTWLEQTYTFLQGSSLENELVAVPLHTIVFGSQNLLLIHPSSRDTKFRPERFVEANYWNSVILVCHRSVFERVRFEATPRQEGFGYEDWHWFSSVIAIGIPVFPVPGTVAFSRRKRIGSRLDFHVGMDTLLRSSLYFSPRAFASRIGNPDQPRRLLLPKIENVKTKIRTVIQHIYGTLRNKVRTNPFARKLYRSMRSALGKFRENTSSERVPTWLLHDWQDINSIEPQLLPDHQTLGRLELYEVRMSAFGNAYAALCSEVPDHPDHVFLVPWLKRGGSDLETINYIRAVSEVRPSSTIILIGTENTDSPWKIRLPKTVKFLEMGQLLSTLNAEQQERLLATLIVQMVPRTVHVLNSRLAYRTIERYGSALKSVTRLFASVFCEDYTQNGLLAGYPVDELPRVEKYLSRIFADNQAILLKVQNMFALDPEKFTVHYHPVAVRPGSAARLQPQPDDNLHIVWTGRLDRQKRPDIAVKIARACENLPVHFHCFGEPLLDSWFSTQEPQRPDNLTFHGGFDGFQEVLVRQYDLLLSTSQWEGLPNVLIEAMAEGLPVLSSGVGGVSELISHQETGLLVSPFDDIEAYLAAIKWALEDRSRLIEMGAKGRDFVQSKHSWEGFKTQVLRGYS